ncbi:MAG: pyridoxamine 5'-phosphate oxidase family protein [Vicinamibacterales bacterium]
MSDDLNKLYEMIDKLEVAMMTTRRQDGHLVSRPMANQKQAPGADLWFVCAEGTPKLDEISSDPHVNLAYYKDRTREWVSVSGLATISRDRATIKQLFAEDWRAWFPKEGDPRHGTPDDPRLVLIGVQVHSALFLEVNKPQPMVLFEIAKGWATGTMPEIGTMHEVKAK